MTQQIKRKRKRRLRWMIPVAAVVVLAAVFLTWRIISQSDGREVVTPLEQWLVSQGYIPLCPLQSQLALGSVLQFDGPMQMLAVPASEFDYGGIQPQEAQSPPVQLRFNTRGSGNLIASLPGLDEVGSSGSGATNVTMELDGLTIRALPLSGVGAAVRQHERLMNRVSNAQADRFRLLVVLEVLEAQKLTLRFERQAEGQLDLNARSKQLAAAVGSDFTVTAAGTIESTEPVVLGFKGYEPHSEALDLAGQEGIIALSPVEPKEFEAWRERQAAMPTVGSQYQITVLAMGLGNYPARISGAPDSASEVASRYGWATTPDHVTVHTSHTRATGGFDSSRTWSRQDIVGAVDAFVNEQHARLDSEQQRLTVFYYCGHGLAEAMARTVFLVPENFRPIEGETALDAADRLVSVAEIVEKLEQLDGPVVLLLDLCREHPDDEEWLAGLILMDKPARQNVKDIVSVLRFTSGAEGPHVLLFGGSPGQLARTVPVTWSQWSVGPLAARLVAFFDNTDFKTKPWTLQDLTKAWQEPHEVAQDQIIRGHTQLRLDFLDQLPDGVVFGQRSLRPLPQGEIGTLGGSEAPGGTTAAPPRGEGQRQSAGGVQVRRASEVDIGGVEDFVYLPEQRRIYAIDTEWVLWTWERDDVQPQLVRRDLHFPKIGSDRQGSVYVHSSGDQRLMRVTADMQLEVVSEDVYMEQFTPGADGNSLLMVEDDHTIGSPDTIWRITDQGRTKADTFDTTNVGALIEWKPGVFLVTSDTGSRILRRSEGRESLFASGVDGPGAMVAGKHYVFVVSFDRRVLYRLNDQGRVEQVSLAQTPLPSTTTNERTLGLAWINDQLLWLATSEGIMSLNLSNVRWREVSGQ